MQLVSQLEHDTASLLHTISAAARATSSSLSFEGNRRLIVDLRDKYAADDR